MPKAPVKTLVIAGTRPEAIKLAPVVRELSSRPEFSVVNCASGQHSTMFTQAMSDFGLTPDLNLEVMRPGQSLAGLTARLFEAVDAAIETTRPDWILVQGDTTTCMAAGMCGFYRRIKVGHVEAGLRSFQRFAPFPEEVNRRVTALTADLHFPPTERAAQNLLKEGVAPDDVVMTGNTVVDALQWMRRIARDNPPELPPEAEAALASGKKLVLVTGHRRESFGQGFADICTALAGIGRARPDAVILYPVHLNPAVLEPVRATLSGAPGVVLTAPVGYRQFVRLLDAAALILTDSGGVQEEGPSLGKQVVVMREVTERPEGVEAGWCHLVGTNPGRITEAVFAGLDGRLAPGGPNPFGDGRASARIADAILSRS